MCFSAQISFLTAAFLAIVGAITFFRVKEKKQRFFAAIPLLFATQQFSEGLLWINFYPKITGYIFLTFAFLIWPVWIPLSVYKLEKPGLRKYILLGFYIFGLLWSVTAGFILAKYGAEITLGCKHIYYNILFSYPKTLGLLSYCIPTIGSFLISSNKNFRIYGILAAGSLLLSYLIWHKYLISTWCFFAALLSIVIATRIRF